MELPSVGQKPDKKWVHKVRKNSITFPMFREAILDIKQKRNLTWAEIGQLTGRHPGQIPGMIHNKEKKWVDLDQVEDIFRRLNGEPLDPTPYQKKLYIEKARKVQSDARADTLKLNKLQEKRSKIEDLKARLSLAQSENE